MTYADAVEADEGGGGSDPVPEAQAELEGEVRSLTWGGCKAVSEFLKFAYELLSQVLYNIVQWLAAFGKLLLTRAGVEYFLIFQTYFPTLNIPAKILSVLLMLVLIAIPVLIIVLLVRHLIMRHKLKMDKTDNAELYREIGRLNKQVISLVDEKNRIRLKVNAMGGTAHIRMWGSWHLPTMCFRPWEM